MRPSLEEERRALLAQIEASRAVYRRMLSGTADVAAQDAARSTHRVVQAEKYAGFPRSRTVRWVMDHPLAVAVGVSVLVWAAPQWWSARRSSRQDKLPGHSVSRRKSAENEPQLAHRDTTNEGKARALLTAAALLMRNPATVRTLSRAASTAWEWFKQRRTHRSHFH